MLTIVAILEPRRNWGLVESGGNAVSVNVELLPGAVGQVDNDAAHAIGDDKLGNGNADDYTHGTSEQRMRWFRRGFDGGDARECDTFALEKYSAL